MNLNIKESLARFRRVRKITYVVIIVIMLTIGTWFLFGGKLYTRISSVTFPPHISSVGNDNLTYIDFRMELEIWNPSILTRFERTANTRFVFSPCIDVTFTNLTGYDTHVVIDALDQNYDEYVSIFDGEERLPAVGRQVLKPGINIETTYYLMVFKEANLTRLPMGEYRMWFKIDLMFGKETVSNAVTMNVFENEIFVVYDTFSDNWGINWGIVSLFKSCLLYYLIGGLMIIIPLVNKLENRRKKQLVY